ncbi:hypothetical protein SDRG_09780 [Saprolegnia diclina VS20]|uniref:Uncharacterized protein n=1 Tax=Saprolegnia diclina (strain VS20) TaxID=1156394 RepID=T0RJQ3_SAPDV|nr:hypothetical protein SDRG_09780 [Saprolegnia diclina VS20]EQC32453.1 hypothetical protein SDRG_09780 [Saprolegnia diclina VS20]|eukprot:XP_008613954.1 hypothetical protein SDRG_09780 [Saprolegnia diclina VS20]
MTKLRRNHQDNAALTARVSSLDVELRAATLVLQQKTNALEITLAKILDDNIVRTVLRDMNADMLSQIAVLEQRLVTMQARHSQENALTSKKITKLETTDAKLQAEVAAKSFDIATIHYEIAKLTPKQARREVNQRRST